MFICVCKGLDEKSLREKCDQGIDTLSKVVKDCGAGGDCGTCAFKINRILKEIEKSPEATEDKEIPLKNTGN